MTAPRTVHVGNLAIGNDQPLTLIAGPCALESRAHALEMSHALVELTGKLGIGLVYKTSFDKANRTSLEGARPGPTAWITPHEPRAASRSRLGVEAASFAVRPPRESCARSPSPSSSRTTIGYTA